ncbi:MAG: hypothetical protein EBU57_02005 [Alphaproteobacteria bacterium]|nr:hypothetical protein [Alphaproteobacteria bacterium]
MGGNEPLFSLIMTGFEKAQIIRQNTDLAMTFAYRAKQAKIDNPALTLEERRFLLDWTIRPALRTVPGVADVVTFGGFERNYQVCVDPIRLTAAGISGSGTATCSPISRELVILRPP